jgi:hypothetical protein
MELERQILLWSEEPWRKAARPPWKGRENGERRKTGLVAATAYALKIAFHYASSICVTETALLIDCNYQIIELP